MVAAPDGSLGTRIDCDDLCRYYHVGGSEVRALDDVDLHVDESAFVVVLGASGSGKTTPVSYTHLTLPTMSTTWGGRGGGGA